MDTNFPFAPGKSRFFYGWTVAVVASIGIICSIPGQTMGVSVFTDILIEKLSINRTAISIAYLGGTLCSGFLVSYMGRWLDRNGIRAGAILSGLGLGMALLFLSQVDRLAGVLGSFLPDSLRVLLTVSVMTLGFFLLRLFGQGLMTLASRNMIAKWFDALRGRVNSYSGVLASFAFAAAPWLLDNLIEGTGWRWAWTLLGLGCGFAFAVLAWVFFRDNPEECGMQMDGPLRGGIPRRTNVDNLLVRDLSREEALRTYSFWSCNLAFANQGFFITGYTFHIISIGENLSIARAAILGAFLPGAVVALFVSLFVGWLIDRTRLKYVVSFFMLGMIFLSVGLLVAPSPLTIPFLVLGFGVAGGCFTPLMGTVWARYFGRRELGAISGFNMSSLIVASALGPIVFSLSYDWFGGYRPAIGFGLLLSILLFLGTFFANNPQRRLAKLAGGG